MPGEHRTRLDRLALDVGTVKGADLASAKAAAAIQFGLDKIQRNRIMVQELA